MRLIIVLIFCFVSVVYGNEYGFVTKYINVPLDHFSFVPHNEFKLRYLVNESYYSAGKPIFFYTGNEGAITDFAQNTGFMFDLAKKIGALIVFAEHRYYGESLPFGNESFTTPENLGFLSSQQALADYVYLINDLQKQYSKPKESTKKLPVIAFGGSYGGMLSAWLRMKYPYSVLGAIASSAPIWQFKGITPCANFNLVATRSMRALGSKTCVDTVQKSWRIFRNISTTPNGKKNISELYQLCKNMESENDLKTFVEWLEGSITMIVQMNYPYPANFSSLLPGHPTREFCREVDSVAYKDDFGLIKAIAKGLQIYTNYSGQSKCNDVLSNASFDSLAWNFQTCTDMIMPMCSTDKDMFENSPWDFKSFSDDCYKQYKVRPRSEFVPILEYGGKDLKTASNIVFSNGLIDPWSSGGVLANVSSQVVSILIPDGAHHYDLRGENPLDTEPVKYARRFHERQILTWLDKFYFENLPLETYLKVNIIQRIES